MAKVWQHPYLNIFKHFKVEEWKRSTKAGDVTTFMDKTLKGTVFRISGSVPASNYLQLPKTSTQSLGLTGRYLYILFKPMPTKYFVVHLDVATEDSQVVRISFSNLFKEFKSTATWLQFPFICGAAQGSVYESTAKAAKRDLVGLAPSNVRWTCLMLDLRYVLALYLNRSYSHLKSVKLCSNLLVKNLFTSDLLFDPAVSFSEAQQAKLELHGVSPMPRDLAFPVPKGEKWHDLYDHIWLEGEVEAHGAKQILPAHTLKDLGALPVLPQGLTASFRLAAAHVQTDPVGQRPKEVTLSKPVRDRVSLIQQITSPKEVPRQSPVLTKDLPKVHLSVSEPLSATRSRARNCLEEGPRAQSDSCLLISPVDDGGVHVYARKNEDVTVQAISADSGENMYAKVPGPKLISGKNSALCTVRKTEFAVPFLIRTLVVKSLQPDPILKLKKIIGFGGVNSRWVSILKVLPAAVALWAAHGAEVVYPCHALIIAIALDSGKQRFFAGHTDKVSALAFNGNNTLLASAQAGQLSMMRLWDFLTGRCLAMFKTGIHSVSCLSLSYNGSILCGTGKDGHGKTVVIVWNATEVTHGGEVVMLAKAHTDVDIQTLKIAFFDDTRMVSCGRDNVRLWRVRSGGLRSCPVNLGEYRSLEFTDLDFEAGHCTERELEDRTLFVCSRSGHVLEIDYKNVTVRNARRLLPAEFQHSHRREKPAFNSGAGIALNGICLSPSFCATASEDGFLRLWPLDFSEVFLEAEHDNPVISVRISPDNLKVLCTTSAGTLGCLDIQSRDYSTVMRSHLDAVLAFSVERFQNQLVTVSRDNTIRVWNLESMQQLYEFTASDETPCAVAFHPSQQIFACGFETGMVRTISLAASKLLEEHNGLTFSPDGNFMYSSCSQGTLALYNCAVQKSHIVRVLANVVSRDAPHSPDALSVSGDGHLLAFVGPSEYIVTLMDAHSLDELLRVDVSIMDLESTSLDTAVRLCFSPFPLGHLLVLTSSYKVLVLNMKTGRLIRTVSHLHKQSCSSLALSPDARYLLTAGDRVLKVWDYWMRFDTNSQVFIGHSEPIRQVKFTPNQKHVISVGDAIFLWDFLGVCTEESCTEELPSSSSSGIEASPEAAPLSAASPEASPEEVPDFTPGANDVPRQLVPRPTVVSPLSLDLSSIHRMVHPGELGGVFLVGAESIFHALSEEEEEEEARPKSHSEGSAKTAAALAAEEPGRSEEPLGTKPEAIRPPLQPPGQAVDERRKETPGSEPQNNVRPDCYRHFAPRFKTSVPSKAFTPPLPGNEGLKLKAIIGYNGNGRRNMVWNPDTGFFAYSCGCVLIVEDLHSGSQQHWFGHPEEISTLAVSHDAQVLASASGQGCGVSRCQIRIWDAQSGACQKALFHHQTQVQAMAYSRDDRLLVTLAIRTHTHGEKTPICIVDIQIQKFHPRANIGEARRQRVHQVSAVAFSPDESHCATCGEDGSVRVWSLASLELVVQFQVLNQSCLCLAWSPACHSVGGAGSPHVVAGYSDGTIRTFSLSRTEMELKMHPHSFAVTALSYSADGEIILSGSKDGLMAVSSPRTGMTVRILTDHRSSPISVIDCTRKQRAELGVDGEDLWLAASTDRRVSIWVSDWMKDKCELIDWLSFPAPTGPEVPSPLPPSLAAFCPWDKSTVAYVGFGLQKEVLFYSLQQKQVVLTIPLPYFATSLSLSPAASIVAVGFNERLLRLIDQAAKTEQDFTGHDDAVGLSRFTPSGRRLFTASYNEILVWEVQDR
ncbi:hypothetical protein lerEdw1_018494 [Lerista edwardsae]|nr:hypothetical protein lerEdw1_018494 [Lerista edwardsae]